MRLLDEREMLISYIVESQIPVPIIEYMIWLSKITYI